jgi:hypothetical protein
MKIVKQRRDGAVRRNKYCGLSDIADSSGMVRLNSCGRIKSPPGPGARPELFDANVVKSIERSRPTVSKYNKKHVKQIHQAC